MIRYILKRLFQALFVLFFVVLFAFVIVRLAPSDPATMMAGDSATPEQVEMIRISMGLDKPLAVQFGIYLKDVLRGNLGISLQYRLPCSEIIFPRLLVSARLAANTTILIVLLSIPLGVLAGSRRGSMTDYFAMGFAMVGQSLAPVWLCVFLIYIFSVKLGWFPAMSNGPGIKYVVLPVVAMGLQHIAQTTRMCRSGMIDVLGQDYITATRAKGVSEAVVTWKYALKNALVPVTTLMGIKLGTMLAGTIIVETIFVWPGIGQMLSQAVSTRDYPLVQSGLLISATMVALVNLVVDIINALIDPRITLE